MCCWDTQRALLFWKSSNCFSPTALCPNPRQWLTTGRAAWGLSEAACLLRCCCSLVCNNCTDVVTLQSRLSGVSHHHVETGFRSACKHLSVYFKKEMQACINRTVIKAQGHAVQHSGTGCSHSASDSRCYRFQVKALWISLASSFRALQKNCRLCSWWFKNT